MHLQVCTYKFICICMRLRTYILTMRFFYFYRFAIIRLLGGEVPADFRISPLRFAWMSPG